MLRRACKIVKKEAKKAAINFRTDFTYVKHCCHHAHYHELQLIIQISGDALKLTIPLISNC